MNIVIAIGLIITLVTGVPVLMQILKNHPRGLIILFFGIMHYFTIFPYKKLEPLKGAIEYGKDTTFSIKSWLSEDYQHVKEKYINENFAFRSTFVRLHNQLQFSLFKVAY